MEDKVQVTLNELYVQIGELSVLKVKYEQMMAGLSRQNLEQAAEIDRLKAKFGVAEDAANGEPAKEETRVGMTD